MIAPIPSVIRLRGPSARFSWCSPAASASARRVWIDLVAHKFMRDSVQRGDESTVQTAPRFAGASDLSIESKVSAEQSVGYPHTQRPRRRYRHGREVAYNRRRTVVVSAITRSFGVGPGVASPGEEIAPPDHDSRRS